MALKRIQDLGPASALDGTELVELEQSGDSVQCTTQDIADLAGAVEAADPVLDPLPPDAVDDAAAAIAGVVVGGLYRNGSILMIRTT